MHPSRTSLCVVVVVRTPKFSIAGQRCGNAVIVNFSSPFFPSEASPEGLLLGVMHFIICIH